LPADETGRLEVLFNDGQKGQFKPLQFHVHAPAEHTVNGHRYPLEFHLVHVDAATGVPAAVIGVFFEESDDPNYTN
jgi:carbonic anhydrase